MMTDGSGHRGLVSGMDASGGCHQLGFCAGLWLLSSSPLSLEKGADPLPPRTKDIVPFLSLDSSVSQPSQGEALCVLM